MPQQLIKTILVDPDNQARKELANHIKDYCPNIEIITQCNSAISAFKAINELQPQLIFLEAEIPEKNGFELLQMFETIKFKIIFVSAYSEYAIQAFRFSAVDFLLKPLIISELMIAVNKVSDELNFRHSFKKLQDLLEKKEDSTIYSQNLVVGHSGGFDVLKTNSIIYCEANGYCTNFYVLGKSKVISSRNIGFYEEILPKNLFMRVHHSYIVNIDHVKGYGNQDEIILTEEHICPLSAAHKHDFFEIFRNRKKTNKFLFHNIETR